MDTKNINYLDVGGIRTRFFEKGTGAPLVLIHGGAIGTGSSFDIFSENLDPLAKRFHVYALDKLGHGETDNPEIDAHYTIERMTEHIIAFVRRLGLERIFLIGQSRGAYNGVAICLDHPELVRALILCNSASITPGIGAIPEFSKRVRAEAPFEVGTREWVRYRAEVMCYSGNIVSEPWVDEWYRIFHLEKSTKARNKMTLLSATVFEPSIDHNKEQMIARVISGGFSTPTLIHWGRDDPSAPLEPMGLKVFDLLASNFAQVSMHVANRAGHFAFREKQAEFNRLAISYFESFGDED